MSKNPAKTLITNNLHTVRIYEIFCIKTNILDQIIEITPNTQLVDTMKYNFLQLKLMVPFYSFSSRAST